ncbi:hypothetical protein RO3G_02656 [Lichtheimia corymbifera JMRC:FSU:9682]|uniref:Bud neck involved protein n=1 Tax=Lichtheimia corymbifera JMRC:FSU:9682 TaxID=1263082 RepID=A0A068S511_9FUNG|nr:hypothetical protein RO3G_02656 [Lichtheimia corymbifera JMRC:FSU:9682]
MSAMVQQTPVALRAPTQQHQEQHHAKKTDDAALATYLTSKLRLDQQPQQDAWVYPQPMVAMVHPHAQQSHQQPHYVPAATTTPSNAYYYYGNATPYAYNDNKQPSHPPSSSRSRPSRPRTPSDTSSIHSAPIHIQKSTSTPNRQFNNNRANRSSQLLKQQQQQHYAAGRRERQKQHHGVPADRPPSLSSTASSVPSPAPSLDSGRRSSITSVSSGTFSIRSEMSVNTKLSLSKRLRKVFSMSHLRSKDNNSTSNLGMIPSRNGSNTSLATVHETGNTSTPRPARRRSFASLFQKNQEHSNTNERPVLRVDTTDAAIRRSMLKGDSPNSAASNRPKSRMMEALPSPTPSATSSTTSSNAQQQQQPHDMAPPPAVGMHYGLPLHGSPRLRPAASSSTSSLNTMTNASSSTEQPRRRLQFCPTIQVHETFAASEYDRRCDSNATCQKMTPMMAMKIKQELNEYKLTDMDVHVDSRQYTHFFL